MNNRAENRHVVDALSDCRAQIKALRETEAKLRAEILADAENRSGDEFDAQVVEITVERIDVELMKAELGLMFLRPFLKQQIQTRVQIKPKPTKKTRAK
ncbi:hypothetical protein [Bradyrhizobium valentinum]|uniref:Uncharacterized protein n=1 Tax=Bradyrhizobium valentinum TaxID=1518501 RepID=A0A0R3MA91_9BRAD|nr:hypothetical protein [Bradyrhizobium valentinum]KRR14531.1 hypothetical protein CP49_25810 [Bradyrhizobium valentinum]